MNSETLITGIKNINARRRLRLYRRDSNVRNLYLAALREYKNTNYFNYVNRLYRINLRRTLLLRRNHSYIKRMYNAFLLAKKSNQPVAQQQDVSEILINSLKKTNTRQILRLNRRNSTVRKLYLAALREYRNTIYFKYVNRLYRINLRRTLVLRRNHSYIIRMYNAFLAAKKSKQPVATTPAPVKKAALLIGINYKGTNSQLYGCENDILNTKKILISKYGFKENEIIMMADSFGIKPTRANILKQMQNLVNKSNSGYSSLWFQYAGHGYYTADYNGDESDKKDECIVTSDMKFITDDEFRKLFTSKINKNAKMFCLMDCCHSGTIMDLKYKYQSNKTNWTTENKYNVGANIIAISGCRDNQYSADAWLNSNWCGAMTTSFLETMAATNYKPNMFTLLDKMRVFLRSKGFTQIPQLTSTQIIRENQVFSV